MLQHLFPHPQCDSHLCCWCFFTLLHLRIRYFIAERHHNRLQHRPPSVWWDRKKKYYRKKHNGNDQNENSNIQRTFCERKKSTRRVLFVFSHFHLVQFLFIFIILYIFFRHRMLFGLHFFYIYILIRTQFISFVLNSDFAETLEMKIILRFGFCFFSSWNWRLHNSILSFSLVFSFLSKLKRNVKRKWCRNYFQYAKDGLSYCFKSVMNVFQ